MNLAKGLERRLEKLVDGASASVFRGRMHPIDIASRLVRQIEFLASDSIAGPQIPNDLVVGMNISDIDPTLDRDDMLLELSNVVTETAAERGWRMVGPPQLQIVTSRKVPRGILDVKGDYVPGELVPWAQLIAEDGSAVLPISNNRTLVGRALDSDVRVANQEVSRHHVVISRENGITSITDLGAANGTFVNDDRLANSSRSINAGDRVVLGNLSFTYRPLF